MIKLQHLEVTVLKKQHVKGQKRWVEVKKINIIFWNRRKINADLLLNIDAAL